MESEQSVEDGLDEECFKHERLGYVLELSK
jgi:hypothetical protein